MASVTLTRGICPLETSRHNVHVTANVAHQYADCISTLATAYESVFIAAIKCVT
ncbi:hypothetical protein [Leptothoe sp. PORK10 BA2]|uniref:hypothetical protein n=1 Tax=Leptothoe sp. PORK10 BA2 TaxID=3110254 RepID=UPI002B21B17D|nr:hypothetical protein [Leptothoe sp. PORK10 BA2]MEA5463455.1 hypothetical protein [Leptothoe sp. PORK10 BA2]